MKRLHCKFILALVAALCLNHPTSAQIPKLDLHSSFGPLKTRPAATGFFDVIGLRAAILGKQNGSFEAWIFPFQVLRDGKLQFALPEFTAPENLAPYLHRLETYPERTTLVYSHPLFTLKLHIFVAPDSPVLCLLLEADTQVDLQVFFSFSAALQPMWPAGLGGQYAFWDEAVPGYIISESRRRYNAVVAAPGSRRHSPPLAHALPQKPNVLSLTISPESGRKNHFPILITADFQNREKCLQQYREALKNLAALYENRRRADSTYLHHTLSLPGSEFDRALLWNKLALHRGLICNPDLGCGLVAGFGPSGASRRPGFAWYFGGDAFINALAFLAFGDAATVRRSLMFLRKYQRDDGKMMHELSQSAALLDWFGEYPYAYIHGDTTPFFLVALHEYYRRTGDREFIAESWPAAEKAFAWCRSTDSDGDGLMENVLAGLGASELGSLREASGVDIYLAAVGTQAWESYAGLAEALNKTAAAGISRELARKARRNLHSRFWNPRKQIYNFSITRAGQQNAALTAWSAFPMIFDLLPVAETRTALVEVASSRLSTDWGSRMLARDSPAYDPLAYNNGAVWPFLTGFVVRALYMQHNAEAGLQTLRNLSNWTFVDAPGRMPEIASGAYFRPLESSVPHQLFSSSGFVTGLLYGLLGLEMNVPRRELVLAPHLPATWDSLRVDNLAFGDDRLSLRVQRTPEGLALSIIHPPATPVTIIFRPAFGPFATLATPSGNLRPQITRTASAADFHFSLKIRSDSVKSLLLPVRDPFIFWLPYHAPEIGDPARQMKLCRIDRIGEKQLRLLLEAPGGSSNLIHYRATAPFRVDNAERLDDGHIRVSFPGEGWVRRTVTITLKK